MNQWMILGIVLIVFGLILFFLRKRIILPLRIARLIKQPHRFFGALSAMLLLAGIYSLLAPLLTVMMGADYWILYSIGLLGCLMLLILFLLP
jgi:hypothetical protein